jgi:hypothetical protein
MSKILFISLLAFLINAKVLGQVEGIVIDGKKIAIQNAIIIVTDTTGKAIDTVKSDKRGGYAFKGLKPGKYNIETKATGFLKAIYKNIEITAATEGTDEGDDTYYAIRLDIILTPDKKP